MPTHTHIQNAHSHTQPGNLRHMNTGTSEWLGMTNPQEFTNPVGDTTAVNQNAGGGGTHNNLPPYIVVYFWKRTA